MLIFVDFRFLGNQVLKDPMDRDFDGHSSFDEPFFVFEIFFDDILELGGVQGREDSFLERFDIEFLLIFGLVFLEEFWNRRYLAFLVFLF